ncbi:hypothetical protein [Streptomyces sp. NBC_01304]|uniref:hypothetical protein n=1 Tax=Streptomyces sp. NBC_01304 TaxID=2903818 RepID=UPI002E13E7DC|nr:hypothetical protein OG430_08835 [Streptomyces sp. NBC_01304]
MRHHTLRNTFVAAGAGVALALSAGSAGADCVSQEVFNSCLSTGNAAMDLARQTETGVDDAAASAALQACYVQCDDDASALQNNLAPVAKW